ncbi:hypothetical protein AB0392_53710, partial [Nonomuraea angiospora]
MTVRFREAVRDTGLGPRTEVAPLAAYLAAEQDLVCRRCGHTVEVAGPAVERWAEAVGSEHGFT